MSVAVLLRHHARRPGLTLALLGVGMFLFGWVLTRIAPTLSQAGAVRGVIAMLPPAFGTMLSQEVLGNLTPRGFLGFGYTHPFALLMMSVWAVRVTAGALGGEIGHGTMDLVAARPVSRSSLVAAAVVTLLGGLAAIAGCEVAGTAVGLAGRPVEGLTAAEFLPVAGMCWLAFAAFGAVGLLVSAGARHGGAVTGALAALIGVSFVLDYVARLWVPLHPARPLSLFLYYQPQGILAAGAGPRDVAVLVGVAVVAIAAAFLVFARRDL